MAGSLVAAVFSGNPLQIIDQSTGIVVAKNLKTAKVVTRFSAEGMKHLMEDGSTYVDARILRPTRMLIDVFCPDLDTLAQINAVLLNRSTVFQINTRGLIIPQMMVDGETLKQGPEMISATPIRISMSQFMIEDVSPIVLANPANSSLIDRGMSLVESAKSSVTDLYAKVSGQVTSFFG